MKFDSQKHHRRSIRLPDYDYSQPGAYFITIVTYQRDCLFGEIKNGEMKRTPMGQIAEEHWRLIPEHFPHVDLGAYIVMPNHVHGIIVIHADQIGMATNSSPSVGGEACLAPTTCLTPTTTRGKTTIHWRNCWFVQICGNKTYWSRIECHGHLAAELLRTYYSK